MSKSTKVRILDVIDLVDDEVYSQAEYSTYLELSNLLDSCMESLDLDKGITQDDVLAGIKASETLEELVYFLIDYFELKEVSDD